MFMYHLLSLIHILYREGDKGENISEDFETLLFSCTYCRMVLCKLTQIWILMRKQLGDGDSDEKGIGV